MRKWTAIWLVLVLTMGLAACSGPEPTQPVQVEVETITVATPVPNDAPGATVEPDAVAWVADGVVGEGEYAHSQVVSQVTLHWSNDADTLYMALEAQTTGWVSVGFKPSSRMGGADYVLGFVQDGQVRMHDAYGDAPIGSHPNDEELGGTDDLGVFGGAEAGVVTTLEFSKALDSGDKYDQPLAPGETVALIVAVGTGDSFAARHSARGAGSITLD